MIQRILNCWMRRTVWTLPALLLAFLVPAAAEECPDLDPLPIPFYGYSLEDCLNLCTTPAPTPTALKCLSKNFQPECDALGELFLNDWGRLSDDPELSWPPCFPGWFSNNEVDLDYDNAKWGDEPPTPRGWGAAARNVATDYCTFYGVGCDEVGHVISLCVLVGGRFDSDEC